MFGGEEETVTLQFEDRLVGVVLDRFGKDTDIRKTADGKFTVRIHAAVSGQFFGWLAGLGSGAVIAAPEEVRERYVAWLQDILGSQQESEKI